MKYSEIETLDFLQRIQSLGIDLRVKDGKLQIIDTENNISKNILEKIKNDKNRILEILNPSNTDKGTISRIKRDGRIPLSYSQERLWFIDQYGDNASYSIPGAIRVKGDLCIKTLDKTLQEIISRHEVLRTNIRLIDDKPSQIIHYQPKFRLKIIDSGKDSEQISEQELIELLEGEIKKPFDLANESLIRVHVYRMGMEESVMFINQHHIISDGWSIGIFIKEFSILYEAFKGNQSSPLPELKLQYADYSVWQREHLQGEFYQKQTDYWKQKLSNAPLLKLPTDKPRPKEQTYNGELINFEIDQTATQRLLNLVKANESTLYITLLTLVKIYCVNIPGQTDISVGSPIANRTRSEVEGLLGFFANTIVLRSELDDTISFKESLSKEKFNTLQAYEYQDIPFESVVGLVSSDRDLSHSPLFQVMMVLQNNPKSELKFSGLDISSVPIESGISKFDLTFDFTETMDGLLCSIEYNTDLFYTETIERMVNHFSMILEQVIETPDILVKDLEILTKAERQQVLEDWIDTKINYPREKCVHELFEEQVERTPENIALVFEGEKLSYRELNERSNQLAHYLQKKGVKTETLVGICVERSVEMIVGILGILKAGGAYVPIDPHYPAAGFPTC